MRLHNPECIALQLGPASGALRLLVLLAKEIPGVDSASAENPRRLSDRGISKDEGKWTRAASPSLFKLRVVCAQGGIALPACFRVYCLSDAVSSQFP